MFIFIVVTWRCGEESRFPSAIITQCEELTEMYRNKISLKYEQLVKRMRFFTTFVCTNIPVGKV